MKTIAPLLLLLAFAQASFAQLSGSLSGTLGPGEFHVVDTVSVEAGDSLTLLPGTTFTFDGPFPFNIYGILLAEGTETDSIIFSTDIADNRRRWEGLRFYNEGSSSSALTYCVVENAVRLGPTGGGVDCHESSPTFSNCVIRGNEGRFGGGVQCWSTSSPIFQECTFVENRAFESGGGAYCATGSSPRFIECSLQGNHARSFGGGIYCQNRSSPIFTNCSVTGNEAGSESREGGGGIYCESSSAVFTDCMLYLNTGHYGGGISCQSCSPRFTNCTIDCCHAPADGGGVSCQTASPTFTHCVISRCTAESEGGGVYCEQSSPRFIESTIIENSASVEGWTGGGGIYCRKQSSPSFTNCVLYGNSANHGSGGAVYCVQSSPAFTGCTIDRNSAYRGGAMHCHSNSSPRFTRCTLSGNSAATYAGGLLLFHSVSPIVNSTVIAFSEGPGIYFADAAESQVEYCDIFGNNGGNIAFDNNNPDVGPPGIGLILRTNANRDPCDRFYNIFLDPMFVDTTVGDFRILPASPCIDAGDPFVRPDSDATVADIGAFFFPQEPPPFSISPDSLNFGSVLYRSDSSMSFWIRNPSNEILRAAGIWVNNPSIFHVYPSFARIFPFDSVEVRVTFTPSRNRTYLDSVIVTFMGLDEMGVVILQGIGAYDCHVLPGGVISGALSAANSPYHVLDDLLLQEPDTLEIEPGVELIFDSPCRFEVHGLLLATGTPQDSIVFTCDTQFNPDHWRGIRFENAPDSSRLEYCVIEYGETEDTWPDNMGGGAYCLNSSPIFTDCTFRYNITHGYGGGMYCSSSAPVFIYCTFWHNSADWSGGGISCVGSPAMFTNCTFTDNTASYSGGGFHGDHSSSNFTSCTLVSNSAGNGAGAMFYYESSLSLTNCSFRDNTANGNGGGAYCDRSSPVFTNCMISNNSAYSTGSYNGHGGGLYCQRSTPNLSNCTFDYNRCSAHGGGLHLYNSSPIVTNCTIYHNSSLSNNGGGIYCNSSSPVIMNCAIEDNSAGAGGGVWCQYSSADFTNCTLNGNSAGTGGAVYCSSSADTFRNCTVAMNSANVRSGGGVYCSSSTTVFNSTIIAFSQFEGIRFQDSESSRVEYCDFFGNTSEIFSFDAWDSSNGPSNIGEISAVNRNGDSCDRYQNIFLNPMFVDTALDDYNILPDSPCAGAADSTDAPPTDIEGNPRPSPPGTLPDVGAYESGSGGHPWAFSLISQEGGDTCWTPDTTLAWHAPFNPETNDSVHYEVWMDTTWYFTTAWEAAADVPDTFSHISGLLDDHAYYWTVHASDLNSDGIWAESPLMFRTYFPEPPGSFSLLSPRDSSQLPPGEVNFRWQAAHDPDPHDTVTYTLRFETSDTSFAYPASSDTCWMFDVGILGAKDSSLAEWWIEAHSTYPDISVESATHRSFYAPRRIPVTFALQQNYPNPFNPATVISYDVSQAGRVSLTIYNLLGQRIGTVFDGEQLAGSYRITWDAGDLPSGVYLCRMQTQGFAQTRKMVLVR